MNYAKTRERDASGKFTIPTIPSDFDRKEYNKNYNFLHREEKIKKAVEWGRKNKDKRKIIRARWRTKNKELTNFLTRNYFYRKDGVVGFHSLQQEKDLFEKFKNLCAYCSKKSQGVDHVVPIRRGGSNFIDNLLPCCFSCNSKKRNQTLEEWRMDLAKKYEYAE